MFERTAASIAIERRLEQGNPGEELDPQQMELICGLECTDSRYPGWKVVANLIPRVEKTTGLVWKWQRDRKVWRCLLDPEKPGYLTHRVRKMNYQATRTLTIGKTIDFEKLDNDQRREAGASMLIAGAVGVLSSRRSQRRLQAYDQNKPSLPDRDGLIAICKAAIARR